MHPSKVQAKKGEEPSQEVTDTSRKFCMYTQYQHNKRVISGVALLHAVIVYPVKGID